MQKNLYMLERREEKILPDTPLDSRIIWAEFMSEKGCKADVPNSADLSNLPL